MNNNNLLYNKLKNINNIEYSDAKEEIKKYIIENNITYSSNKNGLFINLSYLNEKFINDLLNIINNINNIKLIENNIITNIKPNNTLIVKNNNKNKIINNTKLINVIDSYFYEKNKLYFNSIEKNILKYSYLKI